MIRRMQVVHWVVMLANMMFCLSVTILTSRLIGRIRTEHDLDCERIRREGNAEIGRLQKIIWADEDMMRDHNAQITDRDETIDALQAEREEAAKRILSLEDSHSEKCVELDAKNRELEEIKRRYSEVWQFFNMNESTITNQTFQPKRPEDQPQKPMCDN